MKKYHLSDFVFDEASQVYYSPLSKEFKYSDGEAAEQNVYNCIKSVNDRSLFSRELIVQITDWPTEYYFSPLRHNLLRHYQFSASDKILELGCGCGAITRQLGESGASVTAIEGSSFRAKSAAERCRDLDNVEIYCSNFQDIITDKKYDYVTLIGVWEYASIYFEGAEPYKQCLAIAKAALKPGGKLIIAIENRMGLKYFLGYSEDHTDQMYDGIRDFYEVDTAHTFGKKEITNILLSEFKQIKFAYPFPDYKLPQVVVFDDAFNEANFNVAGIISHTSSRDYSFPNKELPDEQFIWQQLESNDLIPSLANSFLIEVSDSEASDVSPVLANYYTVDRRIEFNTVTSFERNGKELVIKKKNISPAVSKNNEALKQVLNEDLYIKGPSLNFLLNRAIAKNDFKKFVECLNTWLNFIFNSGVEKIDSNNKFQSLLKPEYIDAKPGNIIIHGEGLTLIDKEWNYSGSYTFYSLILRYLMEVDASFIHANLPGDASHINKIFASLQIPIDQKIIEKYSLLEKEIFTTVYDECYYNMNGSYLVNNNNVVHPVAINDSGRVKKLLKKVKHKLFH